MKKIPKTYRNLAAQGLRVRFHGFWLGDSKADRAIADWLDKTQNASFSIKRMILDTIVGRYSTPQPTETEEQSSDEIGAAGAALLDLDD